MAKNSDKGVILKVNGTASGSLVNLGMPEVENPVVESTNHDSVASEFVSGRLPKVGELTFTVSLDKTQTSTYYGYVSAGTLLSWNIVFPQTSGSLLFDGILTKFKPSDADAKSPELLTADFTITPSGSATFM